MKPVGTEAEHSATSPLPTDPSPIPIQAASRWYASICPGTEGCVSAEFVKHAKQLGNVLGMPVWFLLQASRPSGDQSQQYDDIISEVVARGFSKSAPHLPRSQVALVIESPGGDAKSAYMIADVLRRRCGSFVAIVPRYAKSAATLLCLGATRIIMAPFSELGPLDAQLLDPEREDTISALDEVHALDRLHAFSLEAIDRTLFFFQGRSGKKIETLLPWSTQLVTSLVRPLFEKIDAVHYTQMSRVLKVAEEYAVRLLQPTHSRRMAQRIARNLVENYPDHRFMIDQEEASRMGLHAELANEEISSVLGQLLRAMPGETIIGEIREDVPK